MREVPAKLARSFCELQLHGEPAERANSVSGGAVLQAGYVVSWFSRSQDHCVTLSTTKNSEYIPLREVTKELMFLKQIRHCLSLVLRCVQKAIFEDNDGGKKLADNPICANRTAAVHSVVATPLLNCLIWT